MGMMRTSTSEYTGESVSFAVGKKWTQCGTYTVKALLMVMVVAASVTVGVNAKVYMEEKFDATWTDRWVAGSMNGWIDEWMDR